MREAGPDQTGQAAPSELLPEPFGGPDPGLGPYGGWHDVAVTGVARTREWNVTALADAPDLEGDEVHFDVLPDGTILVMEEVGDAALAPLAEAVEATLRPPYRAEAVRRTDARWAVAAKAIRVLELPGQTGDALDLTVREGEHELRIDGKRTFGSVPKLELLAGSRFSDYALQAERLDGELWEIRIHPL